MIWEGILCWRGRVCCEGGRPERGLYSFYIIPSPGYVFSNAIFSVMLHYLHFSVVSALLFSLVQIVPFDLEYSAFALTPGSLPSFPERALILSMGASTTMLMMFTSFFS